MGAYFGYSMACGDLDGDGTDDLLVSAPWYSKITSAKSSIVSVGRVYVYYGDQNKVVSNADKPAIIGTIQFDFVCLLVCLLVCLFASFSLECSDNSNFQ